MIQQKFIWYPSVGLVFLIEMYKHACIILYLSDQMNQNCDSCIAGFCSSDALRFRLSSHIHTERSKLGILQHSGENLEQRKVGTSWGYFNTVDKAWNKER